MDNNELLQRIEIEQQHRLEKSKRIIEDQEDRILGDPNSYDDNNELTFEAQSEMNKLGEAVEQFKRGYHHAMEHVKQALRNQPSPLTHSGIERHYQ